MRLKLVSHFMKFHPLNPHKDISCINHSDMARPSYNGVDMKSNSSVIVDGATSRGCSSKPFCKHTNYKGKYNDCFSHLSFGGFTKRTPTGPRGELLVASRGDDVLRGGGDDIIIVVRPHV